METTEKIVESYCRYVKQWFTIPSIKCEGQFEVDLLAVDTTSPKRLRRFHIECGVSISGSYSKLTNRPFSRERLKVRVQQDLARQWLTSLTQSQPARAIFDTRLFGDIVSRNAPRAQSLDAVGLPFAEMDAAQQAHVLKLIGAFADHLQPELTEARLARVRAAPLDSIRVGWAGSDQPHHPHYFRIQGANFLIEFDNSGGNHTTRCGATSKVISAATCCVTITAARRALRFGTVAAERMQRDVLG